VTGSDKLCRFGLASWFAFSLLGCTAVMFGCTPWKNGDSSLIQIQASQNPNKASQLTNAGIRLLNGGNPESAAEKFEAAICADSGYGPAHNNLGLLHYQKGNLFQAVLAFEEAMRWMPHDPSVVYNLALSLEAAGKIDEAEELYLQTVARDPANPNYLGNLVRLRIRRGDRGPEIEQSLRDLILIETRPQWRNWADRMLSIDFNSTLDRGPPVPDFNALTDEERKREQIPIEDRIIDLSESTDPMLDSLGGGKPQEPAGSISSDSIRVHRRIKPAGL
jgi:tetratricopeptide (TPR) repeat protein